jgi:predicted nucleotide-binding protein
MNKFKGSIDDLKQMVESAGFTIASVESKGTFEQIKTENGAILNFFKTGTLQYQGNKEASENLKGALKALTTSGASSPSHPSPDPVAANPSTQNKKVFVVHGHDDKAREQLELVVHKLGLFPFVLQNSSGGGLTIVEALEKEIGPRPEAARFGIVLMTPDDVGYSKAAGEKEAQPRARQNVVLETGMLISALGRPNVAILKKGHLEVPSDAHGIIYLPFNDHVKEVVPKLAERLSQAGFILSPGNITNASS